MRECALDESPSVDVGADGGKNGFLSLFAPVLTGFSAGCVGTRGSGFSGAALGGGESGVANGSESAVLAAAVLAAAGLEVPGDATLLSRAARLQGLMNPPTVSSAGR